VLTSANLGGVIRPTVPLKPLIALALLSAAAGCGTATPTAKQPTYAQLRAALTDSSPALAQLHSKMGKLETGGKTAFNTQLAALRGNPAVVNVWASWCGPCRYEFPVFGDASLKLGNKVGFLGVSSRDSVQAAQTFLTKHPVGYPSWNDSDGAISESVGVAAGLPATVFFNKAGKRTYIHQGPYASVADLERDINKYGSEK